MTEPTPQEIGDLLRTADFAIGHGMTALVAFGHPHFADAMSRDFDLLSEVSRRIKAMLEHFPPAVPLTDDQLARAGRVVGAVLNKRFGNGGDKAITDALDAMSDANAG